MTRLSTFYDRRSTKWPFSQLIANAICEAIASGARLTKLSKNFPTYNVICRWRRESPEFNRAILTAYADRADLFNLNKFSNLIQFKKNLQGISIGEAARQVGVRYPLSLKKKRDKRRETLIIETGLSKLELRGMTRSQALIQILRDIFKINCSFVSS